MEKLKQELLNQIHWEESYYKLVIKKELSKEEKDELWKLKEIYKEEIVEQLISGEYTWSIPKKAEIAKSNTSKKRTVYIYNVKDRFILGVLYRAFSAYYSDKISSSCFSYKKKVNTSSAIKYIKEHRSEDFKYGVKVDIHAYFNSVSKQRLSEIIDELFENKEHSSGLKITMQKLLLTDKVMYNNKEIKEYKSLIPGCALGSFLANYCLRECDYYFDNIEDLIYARYSDDIIIITNSKDKLQIYLNKVLKYIEKYGLTMNPDKYTWFESGDAVEYLGLKLDDSGNVDISNHAKQKIKKQIHRWCRKGRMEIERDNADFNKVASRILRQLNHKNFKCYIKNENTFGWCHYAFRYINTIESLKEIDMYTKDTIRAMKTGKHNKANHKALSDKDLVNLGWISLVELYFLYKKDFDYYCEVIELI